MNTQKENKIGWGMLSNAWFKLAGYIIVIGSIIYFHFPIWLVMIIISVWSIVNAIYYKKFKLKKQLMTLLIMNTFILVLYAVYQLVGGVWAIIIVHIVGISFVVWGNRELIRTARMQIKEEAVKLNKKRRGK